MMLDHVRGDFHMKNGKLNEFSFYEGGKTTNIRLEGPNYVSDNGIEGFSEPLENGKFRRSNKLMQNASFMFNKFY